MIDNFLKGLIAAIFFFIFLIFSLIFYALSEICLNAKVVIQTQTSDTFPKLNDIV